MARKQSEYAIRLAEKQKLKFMYGIRETQFRRYFDNALRDQHDTIGHALLRQLESRLDNVVYRMGFARTRRSARQLVSHGHVLVNGRRVDIPSYSVSKGDVVMLTEKRFSIIRESLEFGSTPEYLSFDAQSGTGVVLRVPSPDELPSQVNTARIVEFYAHA